MNIYIYGLLLIQLSLYGAQMSIDRMFQQLGLNKSDLQAEDTCEKHLKEIECPACKEKHKNCPGAPLSIVYNSQDSTYKDFKNHYCKYHNPEHHSRYNIFFEEAKKQNFTLTDYLEKQKELMVESSDVSSSQLTLCYLCLVPHIKHAPILEFDQTSFEQKLADHYYEKHLNTQLTQFDRQFKDDYVHHIATYAFMDKDENEEVINVLFPGNVTEQEVFTGFDNGEILFTSQRTVSTTDLPMITVDMQARKNIEENFKNNIATYENKIIENDGFYTIICDHCGTELSSKKDKKSLLLNLKEHLIASQYPYMCECGYKEGDLHRLLHKHCAQVHKEALDHQAQENEDVSSLPLFGKLKSDKKLLEYYKKESEKNRKSQKAQKGCIVKCTVPGCPFERTANYPSDVKEVFENHFIGDHCEPKIYECSECDLKSNFKSYIKNHTKNFDHRFSNIFITPGDSEDMKTITEFYQSSCDTCPVSSAICTLKSMQEAARQPVVIPQLPHVIYTKGNDEAAIQAMVNKVQKGQLTITCEICNKSFRASTSNDLKKNYKKHLKAHGEGGFTCSCPHGVKENTLAKLLKDHFHNKHSDGIQGTQPKPYVIDNVALLAHYTAQAQACINILAEDKKVRCKVNGCTHEVAAKMNGDRIKEKDCLERYIPHFLSHCYPAVYTCSECRFASNIENDVMTHVGAIDHRLSSVIIKSDRGEETVAQFLKKEKELPLEDKLVIKKDDITRFLNLSENTVETDMDTEDELPDTTQTSQPRITSAAFRSSAAVIAAARKHSSSHAMQPSSAAMSDISSESESESSEEEQVTSVPKRRKKVSAGAGVYVTRSVVSHVVTLGDQTIETTVTEDEYVKTEKKTTVNNITQQIESILYTFINKTNAGKDLSITLFPHQHKVQMACKVCNKNEQESYSSNVLSFNTLRQFIATDKGPVKKHTSTCCAFDRMMGNSVSDEVTVWKLPVHAMCMDGFTGTKRAELEKVFSKK